MAYNPSIGLLGDQQSLAPSLGLLGRLGNPGEDPIQAALAQMAAQRAQMAPGQGVGAPGAFVPPTPPSQAGGPPGAPEPAPTPPRPAPATRRPLISPTQMALFSAGGELAREDAPSLAHAVSRALAAGVPAFLTSKQAERDQTEADTLDRQWRETVETLDVKPAQRALLRSMSRDAGQKAAEGMLKAEIDPLSQEGVSAQRQVEASRQELTAMYRSPPNIDPLSREGIEAQMDMTRTRLELEASLRERNIDPLSREGLAAQKELLRYKQSIAPDKDGTREPPLAIVTALRGNEGAIEKMNQAITALGQHPQATSPWRLVPGVSSLQDVFGDVDNITARGTVEGAGLATVYDESGKQINRYELLERGDIPRPRDRPDVALKKLTRLRDNAIRANAFLRDTYSPRFGFREIPPRDMTGTGGGSDDVALWNGMTPEQRQAFLSQGGQKPPGAP